jgi:hypothetical protein
MEIYGVDFSGAKDAGRKIWLSQGVLSNGKIVINDSFRLADRPNFGRKREQCLIALREFIEKKRDCAFGFDFPFGLPGKICKDLGFDTWEKFIRKFPEKFDKPDNFKKLCWKIAGNSELKRTTDEESLTPHSPYNLRMFKGTFYGIAGILYPLVNGGKACILPMQRYKPGKTGVIEICPASTLKNEGIYRPYKKSKERNNTIIAEIKRDNRSSILNYLEKQGVIISSANIKNKIVTDDEGDGIDSIIAVYATFKARINPKFPNPDKTKEAYNLEGYVYI